ncbi:hypothetical protein BBL07_05440 [Agrobacterium vitis]|nr:hypothetical protein BBL07_05440 [Agrobacterium vitis]
MLNRRISAPLSRVWLQIGTSRAPYTASSGEHQIGHTGTNLNNYQAASSRLIENSGQFQAASTG